MISINIRVLSSVVLATLVALVTPTEVLAQAILPVSRGGTGTGSFTLGSLLFYNGSTITEDNSNLFWDDTNNRLGIDTSSPTSTLHVNGNTSISGDLSVTGNITGNITATNLVPYTGATSDVDLGSHNLTTNRLISTTDATINGVNVGTGGGGLSNTAIGEDALTNASSTSITNTAIGWKAGGGTGTFSDVIAIGAQALSQSIGSGNVAIGSSAMKENWSGGGNVAIGAAAIRLNDSGNTNTAIGNQALQNSSSGSDNIAIGFLSGYYQANGTFLTTPQSSIYIGRQASGYNNNDSNSIVIGTSAIGAGANTAVIGNSSLTNVYFGSSTANAHTHARVIYSGDYATPGCIVMGDTAGGVGYVTLNSGVLTVSSTKPAICN